MAKKKKKKKTHFTGTDGVSIHTSREGKCGKGSTCVYATNAGSAPGKQCAYQPRQAHHVVCVASTVEYQRLYKGEVKKEIDLVYRDTEWCVNQPPNMVWLPLKGTYTKIANNMKAKKRVARGEAAVWDMDLPCHDWDHNCKDGYTAEVEKEMKDKFWDAIEDTLAEGYCFPHEEAELQLAELEKKFRKELETRGQRNGGTKAAVELTKQPPDKRDKWWLPFSMASDLIAPTRYVAVFGDAPKEIKSLAR